MNPLGLRMYTAWDVCVGGRDGFEVPDKIRNLGGEGAIVSEDNPRPPQFQARSLSTITSTFQL